MSCFTAVSNITANSELDLTKHVNYTAGMILGVDDFTQEFAYLAGRDRWLARDLLGYGTVSGLKIDAAVDGAKGQRLMVFPGVAMSPRGQFICVPSAQCAYLNQWLAANVKSVKDKVRKRTVGSPPSGADAELTVYVKLCYRDCLTDNVPIPGEPCRDENELTAASRIKDDFSLELTLEPPKQAEEMAVRDFAEWLKAIKVTEIGVPTPLDKFLKEIRAKWLSHTSPPITSPPDNLQIHPNDVSEYMRAAFRLWVTELRTVLSDRKVGCSVEMTDGAELEDCVLLAELLIPLEIVSPGWKVSDTEDIEIIEENRPFVLHLRMLQELFAVTSSDIYSLDELSDVSVPSPHEGQLLIYRNGEWVSKTVVYNLDDLGDVVLPSPLVEGQVLTFRGGVWVAEAPAAHDHTLDSLTDVDAPNPQKQQSLIFDGTNWIADNISLDDLKDVDLTLPSKDDQVLTFKKNKWIAKDPVASGGGVSDHGALTGLADDDHPQYLKTDGTRPLTGSLLGGDKQIKNLAPGTDLKDAVIVQQVVKVIDNAGGDIGGNFSNLTINQLQGKPVKANTPNSGDSLVWDGNFWIPAKKSQLTLPLATITRVDEDPLKPNTKVFYEIWFNIAAPENSAKISLLNPKEHLTIFEETEQASFLNEIFEFTIKPSVRNIFILRFQQPEPAKMRFRFNVQKIIVEFEGKKPTLFDYADKNNIKFNGYLDGTFATLFVRGLSKST